MSKKANMENLEFIENYFKGDNNEAQKKQFEKKITEDYTFAEEVAFYISANGLIQHRSGKKRNNDSGKYTISKK